MTISKDYSAVAKHYEELATKVFDCERMEDPWGYADAGEYDAYFIEPGDEAKMRLYTIIDVAIRDNEGEKIVEELLKVKGRVTAVKSQDKAIKIIHDLSNLMNGVGC